MTIELADSAHDQEHAFVAEALRDLAANIMRVCRGTGAPHKVAEQSLAVVEAFREYQKAIGKWPSSEEISAALKVRDEPLDRLKGEEREFIWTREQIVHGAIGVAAARLSADHGFARAHERRSEMEMLDSAERLEKIRHPSQKRR
jgi:hypothetical protein